ncbi:MAG: tetratricopeptide repeat protein [Roseomonas sp.]|nr:tetratricopeptide repeat protein [Roseomonas sp.]MCA3326315.1 tetratricopeptide repeat protein [Roseomonas sp.]MCA3331427.1 tetratricopeptide repeat protein [Roseomonas sp.]MCA3335506.1 tetratricopeptide repeat protein [Roseomonas sp.]MCA3348311.1 tetratricopeptide repeat protein [Roseomonas sp.]
MTGELRLKGGKASVYSPKTVAEAINAARTPTKIAVTTKQRRSYAIDRGFPGAFPVNQPERGMLWTKRQTAFHDATRPIQCGHSTHHMKPKSQSTRQQLAEAVSLLQEGQLAAAEVAFRAILKHDARNFDALHFAGVAAAQAGRPEEGISFIRRALAINPRHTSALGNLGSALIRLGRYEEALSSLDRALAIDPKAANVHHNRGFALMKLKRVDDSIAAFDRAIALKPDFVEAHNDRASVLMDKFKLEEALAAYEKALSLRPNSPAFMVNVALVLYALKRHAEALAVADKALQIEPNNSNALIARAQALLRLGRVAEGLEVIESVIKINPNLVQAHLWRCQALHLLAQPEAALIAATKARALAPQEVRVHTTYGFILGSLNRLEEALVSYEKGLMLEPGNTETVWNKALALLVLGRFEEGWLAYEYRNLRYETVAARKYPKPLWWGKESLRDQRIYVYWEQGLGDTIHFARYALLAVAAGARVTFSVQDPLRRLFEGFDPAVTIIGQNEEPDEFDLHCPLLSLPLAFGTRLETIPAWENGYLRAPVEDVARWDRRLPTGRRRIGLVWSGSQIHGNDANRSVRLAKVLPLLQPDDVWISLQKEVREVDRIALEASGIIDVSAELSDFADTAALISSLDLVIAVDTSVAHLAGALGKPTWLMLPFSPDFRWLLNREDSPWYPKMRLFRQSRAGDWDGVLARMSAALRHELET